MIRFCSIAILLFFITGLLHGTDKKAVSDFDDNSRQCLKCHGNHYYSLTDSASAKTIKRPMYDLIKIDTGAYKVSAHHTFTCTDCHAAGYSSYPHGVALRFEDGWTCLDCHGNDEAYSKYNFEKIDAEYQQSVHHTKANGNMSCWDCHNPHTYKPSMRNTGDMKQSIAYNNDICLSCHSDFDRFQLLSNQKEINLVKKHEWLPNQSLHFSKVRCIECHAANNDSILVSHRIMPKEKAVKLCVECHSSNSLLMSSLYKYRSKENRSKNGFLNAMMMNDSYVIGANRNVFLNNISIGVFIITLLGLFTHLLIRVFTRKK
jgi:hypothetical protein